MLNFFKKNKNKNKNKKDENIFLLFKLLDF